MIGSILCVCATVRLRAQIVQDVVWSGVKAIALVSQDADVMVCTCREEGGLSRHLAAIFNVT
jgi:hypothetical protein